ncbi:DUF7511 domain-containing protein [Salinilacihabitans rarus]|uniref:DUF7511 domain-containing protein n=1 Tax=Salinilacihabitans rarus TaxID=2961596 RepID=UPI0020C844B0|nr:hypothetical protein [Salinilacihabitans rarus]
MTVNEAPVGDADGRRQDGTLELLTDDEVNWTAVPAEATGDERMTRWITVECHLLCDLEEWR